MSKKPCPSCGRELKEHAVIYNKLRTTADIVKVVTVEFRKYRDKNALKRYGINI